MSSHEWKAQMTSEERFYFVGRVHIVSDDITECEVTCEVTPLGFFDDHASAYEAVLVDHPKIDPDGELFWTRPNWTAVSKEGPWTWHILHLEGRKNGDVPAPGCRQLSWGPLEYELDA
jgi:hypothetical protein